MSKYDDIINLPHHTSRVHPRMSLYNRSAQFAPFAALTAYGDAISETARLTDKRIEIDEGLKSVINNRLSEIMKVIKEQPLITVIYFLKDKYKDGGKYITVNEKVKRIDEYENKIIFINNKKIPIIDIIDVKICK